MATQLKVSLHVQFWNTIYALWICSFILWIKYNNKNINFKLIFRLNNYFHSKRNSKIEFKRREDFQFAASHLKVSLHLKFRSAFYASYSEPNQKKQKVYISSQFSFTQNKIAENNFRKPKIFSLWLQNLRLIHICNFELHFGVQFAIHMINLTPENICKTPNSLSNAFYSGPRLMQLENAYFKCAAKPDV